MNQIAFTEEHLRKCQWSSTIIPEVYHLYGLRSGSPYRIDSHQSLTALQVIAERHARPWVICRNGSVIHVAGQPPFTDTAA